MADKVTVRTRAAGEKPENGVFWESAGEGEYTVADITKEDRGTEITLHLREGEDEFLDDWRVRSIISKYSDHIALPVEIENAKRKTAKPLSPREKINKAQALWTRNKSEITDEEYKEFYKHIAHDFNDPLTRATTALKVSRSTPACCTFRLRHRGICGTAIINTV